MDKDTILMIEADIETQKLMKVFFKSEGWHFIQTDSGLGGISLFYSERPDAVLLDMQLPDMDSLRVLKQIRRKSAAPVIAISASCLEKDKVTALDSGADDYVVKPFSPNELLARIRAALRRRRTVYESKVNIFELDYLRIDFTNRRVYVHGKAVHLTPLEYKLLVLLADNRGKVLTNHYIQQEIWGNDSSEDYRRLRVFVGNIRKKINDNAEKPRFIHTKIGVGYQFSDE